jgi:hypothetical protein
MKITKKQLKRLIREEKQKLINEQWDELEISSVLINFARAYRGLGDAVASQVDQVVAAYLDGDNETFLEAVYEVNPNAIDMAMRKLGPVLRYGELGDEGDIIKDALLEAQKIFKQGDEEVEADRQAAGDF